MRKCRTPIVCDNLAVQRLTVAADAFEAIAGSPERIEHLRAFVERAVNAVPVVAQTIPTYWHGRGGASFPAVWIRLAGRVDVVLAEGKVFVQGPDRALVASLSPLVDEFTKRQAIAAAQSKLASAVRSRYIVKSDQTNHNGVRVQRIVI